MSLLTYDDVRPHAKDIRDEVSEGHMPPWHAAAPKGTFLNERGLTPEEKDVLVRWAAAGAPKGDPKDLPPAPVYPDGWAMGKPDVVFEMQEEYTVPADGVIEYQVLLHSDELHRSRSGFRRSSCGPATVKSCTTRWRSIGPRPTCSARLFSGPIATRWSCRRPPKQGTRPQREDQTPSRLLATYAPGTNPQVLRPGTAIRLEPGGVIELQMHYTANGKAAKDRTKIGFQFSKDPSPREVRVTQFFNGTLSLPAGSPDVRVDADISFVSDAVVWGIFPHTHVRGKKWEYVLELPDGTKKNVLSVPTYDFNWQTYYMFTEPLAGPEGLAARVERVVRQLGGEQIESRTRKSTSSGAIRRGRRCSTRASSSVRPSRHRRHRRLTDSMTLSSGRHAIRAAGASIAAASGLALVAAAVGVAAHDPIKTRVTWTGDIARIVDARCVSCHYPGVRGTMSLATRGRAAVGARHQGRSPDAADAEVAGRARLRRLQQRSVAVAVRDRARRRVGRRRRAEGD